MRNSFLTLLISLISLQTWAFSIQQEVKELQRDFGQAKSYPIVVADKASVRAYLQGLGLLDKNNADKEQADALKKYFSNYVELNDLEASNIVPYFTTMNGMASSLPFFESTFNSRKMTKCFVFPNGENLTHQQEAERVLGIEAQSKHLYSAADIEAVMASLSHEKLKLLSLYHELSHCLDPQFTQALYTGGSEHDIHKAEVFSEVNAIFMLYQRKGWRDLTLPRASLRGMYTKTIGPFKALHSKGDDIERQMKSGSIYYLSNGILKAQQKIDDFKLGLKKMPLQKTLELSVRVTEDHALSPRGFIALHFSLSKGKERTIQEYQKLALEHPELFVVPYLELKSTWDYLDLISE